ncbi:MAG: hypothetical protein M1823_004253 [Watsoniomyces obsoletus]|nr:MAG: hypothetical protein M1823_004253 [Watsoniomyces obsoletus]
MFSAGRPCNCREQLTKLVRFGQGGSPTLSTEVQAVRFNSGRTVLGLMLTLAHRLGMTWECFRPEEGMLGAVGNGHEMRGSFEDGIIRLHYRSIGRPSVTQMCTPSEVADKFGFGILSGDPALDIPDFHVGTIEDVTRSLRILLRFLDPDGASIQHIMDIRNFFSWDVTFGFSDLIAIICPIARLAGSNINRIRMPARYCAGLLAHDVGRVVFRHKLHALLTVLPNPPPQAVRVLQICNKLARDHPECEDEARANAQRNRLTGFRDVVHNLWCDLVASHIRHVVHYCDDSFRRIQEGKARSVNKNWIEEGAYCYWDYLPRIVADMGKHRVDESTAHSAWYTMMLRGFLWHRVHHLYEGSENPNYVPNILPAKWVDSSLQVKLGNDPY